MLQALIRGQKIRFSRLSPDHVRSVLCTELTRLGDLAISLPAIAAFRRRFPEAELAVAVRAEYAGLLRFLPMIDHIVSVGSEGGAAQLFRTARNIRSSPFDLACSLSPSSRNALLTLSTPARAKLGYFQINESLTPFLHHNPVHAAGCRIPDIAYGRESIYERPKKLCLALGINEFPTVEWSVPTPDLEILKSKLVDTGWLPGKLVVVIHPFAGWSYREWPLDRFVSLASSIVDEWHAFIVFVGNDAEWRERQSIWSNIRVMQGMTALKTTDVSDLARLFTIANVFVGNDSGPLHLAASFGLPTVGIFGPAPPDLTGIDGAFARNLYHREPCSPCAQLKCIQPNSPCIEMVRRDDVFRAVNELLVRVQSLQSR